MTVRLPMACDRLDSDTSHPRMKSSTDLRALNFTRACFCDLWGVSKIGVDIYAPVHSPYYKMVSPDSDTQLEVGIPNC